MSIVRRRAKGELYDLIEALWTHCPYPDDIAKAVKRSPQRVRMIVAELGLKRPKRKPPSWTEMKTGLPHGLVERLMQFRKQSAKTGNIADVK